MYNFSTGFDTLYNFSTGFDTWYNFSTGFDTWYNFSTGFDTWYNFSTGFDTIYNFSTGFDTFTEEVGISREDSMKRNMSLDVQFDEQDLVKVHSISTCFLPLSSKLCSF